MSKTLFSDLSGHQFRARPLQMTPHGFARAVGVAGRDCLDDRGMMVMHGTLEVALSRPEGPGNAQAEHDVGAQGFQAVEIKGVPGRGSDSAMKVIVTFGQGRPSPQLGGDIP
jgi:hypothetical protein